MTTALHENKFFSVILKNGHFVVSERFKCNGAVLAARDKAGNYILVEQLRKAIGIVSLEFPRGARDPGEDLGTTALRELQEETGYQASEAHLLGVLHTNNSLLESHVELFTADRARLSDQDIDGEVQKVLTLSPEQLLDAVASGKITDSHTLAAITYLLAKGVFSSRN